MASRTTSTSRSRTGRRPAPSRSRSRRPPAKAKRSRRGPGPIVRGLRAIWIMLAKGVGGLARTVGRARDIEPGVRRDGVAFALIAVGVVAAAGMWWGTGGRVSAWLETGVRTGIGAGAIALPLGLLVIGVTL